MEPLIHYLLGSAVRSPTLSMESDGNDSLVDKKGGPENLLEFAREADIIVTCLALNPETVNSMSFIFCLSILLHATIHSLCYCLTPKYMWLIHLLGRHSEPEIPLFNETGLQFITSPIFYQFP